MSAQINLTMEDILGNRCSIEYENLPTIWKETFSFDAISHRIALASMKEYATQQTAEKDARIKELEGEVDELEESNKVQELARCEAQEERQATLEELEAVKKERDDMKHRFVALQFGGHETIPPEVNEAANYHCQGNMLYAAMKSGFIAGWKWTKNTYRISSDKNDPKPEPHGKD